MTDAAPDEIDIPITLRAGVVHRYRKPNFVVVSHVYGEKPRLKWIKPLPRNGRNRRGAAMRNGKDRNGR